MGDRSDQVLNNSFWSYRNDDVAPQITNKLDIKLDVDSIDDENPLLTLKINDKIYFENLEVIKDTNLTTAELKNMVTSPGGTTISALRVLENKSLRSALIEAVISASNRSKEFS